VSSDDGTDGTDATPAEPARPALRIVRGTPDEVELAALVAVLAARGSGDGDEPAAPQRGGWSDHARRVRPVHMHGAGGWRSSALPR
jgi:hypothetical protein